MSKKTMFDSFVSQFAALITGDDATVKAEKVFRKAVSGLKSQIAAQEAETISLEDALEAAKDHMQKARLNHGELITSMDGYVKNLLVAKNALTVAEDDLEDHKEKLDFLKSELAALVG